MHKVWAALLCFAAGGAALAEGWTPMSGEDIGVALTDRKLQYTSAWQEFRASGRTLYNAGADSWGYWRVQGDQYRSQWPPSDLWACYDMQRSGDRLRFVGQGDDITEAVYAD
ncbi:hypothetical protein [uncultured Roseobacter sp.]|uniref:hypothetical protein n=1 Tax=uncultured Roseobacter sp. TaxID=114847 RepID=UPI002613BD55|nr:hypothetical protein [uncultured Roseobacter sp.]